MGSSFETTKWSLVLAAQTDETAVAGDALAELCSIYWYPLYAFLRRRGTPEDHARDLTQGFFVEILEKDALRRVSPTEGKFRSFLLASLKNFLSHERDRERAIKRGGGKPNLSLDMEDAEGRYKLEPVDDLTPDALYEKRWALTIFDRAMKTLREEFSVQGKAETFAKLSRFLTDAGPRPSYKEVAAMLGTTEPAVKMAIRRMRQRLGAILREEVSHTVQSEDEIDDELRQLIEIVRTV